MIKPMLAIPAEKAYIKDYADWAVEEKFDGHRLIVSVTSGKVTAWTRPRKHAGSEGKTMAERALPPHLVEQLSSLSAGVYDGELMAGNTSTDVTRTDLQHEQIFVVFDFLEVAGLPTWTRPWTERQDLLKSLFAFVNLTHVRLAEAVCVTCQDDVTRFAKRVWARGGEGVMMKRRSAAYQPGKRSPDLVKVKKLQTAVCVVIGYAPTKGQVLNRGAHAMVRLRDVDGHETSVKTVDDEALAAFDANPDAFLGRKLRIEYQDRAANGGYRHPRWDRWEDE